MMNNYASLHVFLQCISIFYHRMFMGLVARLAAVVASSLLVGGSGTLQCGIKAHIAAWASMGHEEVVTEAGYPLPNREKNEKDRKISKFF